jgi:hypothetical protein
MSMTAVLRQALRMLLENQPEVDSRRRRWQRPEALEL